MKKNKKNRQTRAYMTVEAALIIPFVTLGIVFLIICGFYLYNASYIKQTAYVAAVRGAALKYNNDNEIKRKTEEQLKLLLDNKLLMMNQPEIIVNTGIFIIPLMLTSIFE